MHASAHVHVIVNRNTYNLQSLRQRIMHEVTIKLYIRDVFLERWHSRLAVVHTIFTPAIRLRGETSPAAEMQTRIPDGIPIRCDTTAWYFRKAVTMARYYEFSGNCREFGEDRGTGASLAWVREPRQNPTNARTRGLYLILTVQVVKGERRSADLVAVPRDELSKVSATIVSNTRNVIVADRATPKLNNVGDFRARRLREIEILRVCFEGGKGKGGRKIAVHAPRLRYFQTRDNDPLVKKWGHALVQCLLICLPLHENMENLLEK